MAWTKVNKPTGPTYTNINPAGKEQYDQADITYDSATTYYDGINPSQWSNVSKPVSVSLPWIQATFPWSQANFSWGSDWHVVAKPV